MEKTKEQLLKETVERFKFLTEYNFQPKGFGFTETPDNGEEIKEKIVIKEESLSAGKWYFKLAVDSGAHKKGTWLYINAKDRNEAISHLTKYDKNKNIYDWESLTNVNPMPATPAGTT